MVPISRLSRDSGSRPARMLTLGQYEKFFHLQQRTLREGIGNSLWLLLSGRASVNGELQHISWLSHLPLPLPTIPLSCYKEDQRLESKKNWRKESLCLALLPPGSQKSQVRGHRQPLELWSGGTMNWQQLWLGFLLPMTVSGRVLGLAEKEMAVVSPPRKRPGPGEGQGLLPIQASLLTPSLPAFPLLPLPHGLPCPSPAASPCST